MRKFALFLLVICPLIFSSKTFAQIKFEPGYYIDNNGNREEVLIKNLEWLDNPSSFIYKKGSSEPKMLTVKDVKEFGINNGVSYSRHNIKLDISRDEPENISDSRLPEFVDLQVYLQKIVEGKASLFYFSGEGVRRYFFSIENDSIEPLIYKRYITKKQNIAYNKGFVLQLKNAFNCLNDSGYKFKKLKYNLKSLTSVFQANNACNGESDIVYKQQSKKMLQKDMFDLRIKAGARFNDFSFRAISVNEMSTKMGIQVGLEGEFFLNFNKKKWSALVEASYFSFQNEYNRPFNDLNDNVVGDNYSIQGDIDYSAIELSIGARHSIYFNNNSRLFINANLNIIPINLTQELNVSTTLTPISETFQNSYNKFLTNSSLGLAMGYDIRNVSVEFKYITNRSLPNIDSKYSNYNITIGYEIF